MSASTVVQFSWKDRSPPRGRFVRFFSGNLCGALSPTCEPDRLTDDLFARYDSAQVKKPRHKGVAMASVMIDCPETGREIYTGIETDEASFAKLPDVLSRMQCPVCGQEHVWTRENARLAAGGLKQVA